MELEKLTERQQYKVKYSQ